MIDFHPIMAHEPKDDANDANNNVIRPIYQVPIIDDFNLEWRVNAEKFRIIAENLSKNSQNTMLTSKIATSITNVVPRFMEIK
jgi:hypothetical protein